MPGVPILTSARRLSGSSAMISWIPVTRDEARGLLISLEIAYEPVRESDCSNHNFMDREIVLVRENLFEQNTANITGLEPNHEYCVACLLYTSPSPRDATLSRMPSSA